MKHDTGFIDVSIPYQGYKLSFCLERIEDIGEFTLFCLHAFGDGLNLSDLSQVTEIDSITIQKHLDFLVKRGFINEKHKISAYGCNILKLHDKINKFNRTNRVVFLENAVREKIKRWRECQELTDRSCGWLIAGEDLSLQEFEKLYNARKDIDQVLRLLDNTKDFKDVSDEIRVRLEPKKVERFLVFKINPKALTPTKIEGRTYIRAIHGEQECFIEIETLCKQL
ncbi:MarR family transcriptional regulator [Helicobacter pylori]|uniref:MarR family transcriptional regulator n=1 Tax=Helicobacter pylori TaxID=210 RepID=UPI000FDCF393|nr:MarR family transcriptional regulator [Helicobacter pylori]RVY77734.1 MarR family transcriptional regulator [Helicobacter pylori]